jgi:hypothetical protein
MKINTAELKRFKSNSSFIRQNNILPILGYLKFHEGEVTKTNMHSFITEQLDFKGSLLVDEMILYSFLNGTSSPTIDISVKDNRVVISDSNTKVFCHYEDIQNFPAVSEASEETFEMTNEMMCAIKNASNFVDQMELPDMRAHVFIGGNIIAGCNGFIGYSEIFKEQFPRIVLSKEIATTVGRFNAATFSQNDSYVFFNTRTSRYGFIKPTYPFLDLTRISVIDKTLTSFVVEKEEVISFTEMCTSSTKTKGLVATFTISKGKLNMSMIDGDFSVDVSKTIPVDGEMSEDFSFNPALMSTVLKNIPDSEITVYQDDKSLLMTGETGFVAMILKMVVI